MANFEENTQHLPRLPVPKLKDTLHKYLRSLKSIIDSNEMLRTIQLVEKFESSDLARQLQDYIEKRAEEKLNWFDEWGLRMKYLNNRLPTVLYSSPAHMFPLESFKEEGEWLSYTARLIYAAASYKMLIDSGELPVDRTDDIERDMSQYKKMFGTCRIPHKSSDENAYHPNAEHIIVAYKNQFFKVQIFYNSSPISEKILLAELNTIVEEKLEPTIPIGILTTQERDTWASIYNELLKDSFNEMKDIESCLFVVCLDSAMYESGIDLNRMTKAGRQLLHGGGSKLNGGNRWYDKTLQFIIGNGGIVGLIFEHSLCDGQPIGNMVEYLNNSMKSKLNEKCSGVMSPVRTSKLCFRITNSMLRYIKKAEDDLNKVVENSDIEWFKFKLFGKDFIKNVNLSPDSYVQIALQLAFYRLHGVPAIIYESVTTNKYVKGRLEWLWSFSEESIAFVKIALNPTKTNREKCLALRLAINNHKIDVREAADGYGIEKHLIGLKAAANELNLDIPSILSGGTFTRSTTNRVSTSQVVTSCDSVVGFGIAPTNLYSCCYNIRHFDINMSIFSFRSNFFTKSANMKNAIILSLCNMRDILTLDDE